MAIAGYYDFLKFRCIVIIKPLCFSALLYSILLPSPSSPLTRSTPSGCWTNLFVKTCLASATPPPPPHLPNTTPQTHTPPSAPLSPAAGHHRSSSSTTSQPREIEMLRAGTTAPLIKFPRLIPADPLIALSHQALQGDRGQRPGEQQTNIQH